MKFLIQFSFYVVCIVLTVMLATCKGWPVVPWVVLAAVVPLLVKKFGFSSDDDIPPPPSSGDDIPPPPTDPPSRPPPPELPLPVPNPGGDGQSPMAREAELEFEEDEEDKEPVTHHSPQALPQGNYDRLDWLMRFIKGNTDRQTGAEQVPDC